MADAPEQKRAKGTLFWVLVAAAALGCAGLGAALLFVVATPAIAQAIERAEVNACAAEMRGVFQDLIQYKVQYNDKFPDGAVAMETWLTDEDDVAASSSYAWRDMQSFPLKRFPDSVREPIAACGGEPRHAPDVLHVLYTDGSIDTLSLAELKADGVVPAEADAVPVAPDSPVPELRKLIGG